MSVLGIIGLVYLVIFIISAIITIYGFTHAIEVDPKEPFLHGETHNNVVYSDDENEE